jgi:hypothetical protein
MSRGGRQRRGGGTGDDNRQGENANNEFHEMAFLYNHLLGGKLLPGVTKMVVDADDTKPTVFKDIHKFLLIF